MLVKCSVFRVQPHFEVATFDKRYLLLSNEAGYPCFSPLSSPLCIALQREDTHNNVDDEGNGTNAELAGEDDEEEDNGGRHNDNADGDDDDDGALLSDDDREEEETGDGEEDVAHIDESSRHSSGASHVHSRSIHRHHRRSRANFHSGDNPSQKQDTLNKTTQKKKQKLCVLALDKRCYNVTPFLADHPGGKSNLWRYSGHDATQVFDIYGHSEWAHAFMRRHLMVLDAVAFVGGHGGKRKSACLNVLGPGGRQVKFLIPLSCLSLTLICCAHFPSAYF